MWLYEGADNENDNWPEYCPSCDNTLEANYRQSPIDINSDLVKMGSKPLPKLTFTPNSEDTVGEWANVNGNTLQFTPTDPTLNTMCGGPLTGEYNFGQVHCHWGKTNYRLDPLREPSKMLNPGSEHWLEGKQ